jgi:diguanylate cyclase (GGDEF)-like protein
MSAFLATQLDFVLFFHGLAFLMLGIVGLTIVRGRPDGAKFAMLGAFGVIHGGSVWLDLLAFMSGDSPAFALFRSAVMAVSFIALVESTRRETTRLKAPTFGPWIYAVLLLPLAFAWSLGNLADVNAATRYGLGLTGALGEAVALTFFAMKHAGRTRRWALAAVFSFLAYGIAAGLIVPAASFWPSNVIDQDSFSRLTGVPIQLVRALLGCWIAFSIWGLRQQRVIHEVSSAGYSSAMERQLRRTLVAMVVILGGGWMLTEHLGVINRQNVQDESRIYFGLISGRLAAENDAATARVKTFARSPEAQAILAGSRRDPKAPNTLLQRYLEAPEAGLVYLLDTSGVVVATTNPDATVRSNNSILRSALAGKVGHAFVFDRAHGLTSYLTGYPVYNPEGGVIGVAVAETSTTTFASDLADFDRLVVLVDPQGVVVLTNRPKLMLRNMWPLSAPPRSGVLAPDPSVAGPIVMLEIVDSTWIDMNGDQVYAQRRMIGESSLLMLSAPRGIVASRLLGILITLLAAALTMTYLLGRRRLLLDEVQLSKTVKLEEKTRALDFQASTDELTGTFNRFKFNHELAIQIAGAQRYGTALSLVIYDVDHFKLINDTHGHLAGDAVLRHLVGLSTVQIRSTDVHARWGGEEFVILAPGCTAVMARQMAELLRGKIEHSEFGSVGTITCSFGVAEFATGDTAEVLIARADHALYTAKHRGRNRVEIADPTARHVSEIEAVA